MDIKINGEKAKLYFSQDPQGVDVCIDFGWGGRPYICRINTDGTLTLYSEVDERLQQEDKEQHIKVKTEFE